MWSFAAKPIINSVDCNNVYTSMYLKFRFAFCKNVCALSNDGYSSMQNRIYGDSYSFDL